MYFISSGQRERSNVFDQLYAATEDALRDPAVQALGLDPAITDLLDKLYLPNMSGGKFVPTEAGRACGRIALVPVTDEQAYAGVDISAIAYQFGETQRVPRKIESDIYGGVLRGKRLAALLKRYHDGPLDGAEPIGGFLPCVLYLPDGLNAQTCMTSQLDANSRRYRQGPSTIAYRISNLVEYPYRVNAATMLHEFTHVNDNQRDGVLARTRISRAASELRAYKTTRDVLGDQYEDINIAKTAKHAAELQEVYALKSKPRVVTEGLADAMMAHGLVSLGR
ncbi:MAG TPA: hypothetical protein VLF91_03720 [Candidatus Saccharimonadales bacterium]|nr:hypothetical protein [Candidatus Saccharimonadales bacterium]